ncbi:hypothetical protein H0I76_15685 [Limibaculum sp. M0105]|uniref:Uncharacterized protein n=1 Tax=Thermohalobaculum xanthum TaxID=2753746 RepID=A0A8J7SIZ4_9RHOB|nr:hypothetical protein [Thermohalobaculum xanthum]MBK0400640.1 hypothetical protein [Thermohalobaculum xanthum]
MGAANGERVETGSRKRRRPHKAGDVTFTRLANGNIKVTGDACPYDIAEAIRRWKAKKAEKRAPIGADGAAARRARMRRKLVRT